MFKRMTVIGTFEGEPIFAHVEARNTDEAWTSAVRQLHPDREPDAADGVSFTGLCIAVLDGWVTPLCVDPSAVAVDF